MTQAPSGSKAIVLLAWIKPILLVNGLEATVNLIGERRLSLFAEASSTVHHLVLDVESVESPVLV